MLYGADLETRNFGSGFPLLSNPPETQDYAEYLEFGWNLNNIAKLPGSLLAFESCDTSTASLPRLYVGMCFSSLCWVRYIISVLSSHKPRDLFPFYAWVRPVLFCACRRLSGSLTFCSFSYSSIF